MTNIASAIAADLAPPASTAEPAPRFALRAALVIGAIVLGDFLFFERAVGISLLLFILALAAALLIAARPPLKPALLATAALVLALLPLVEEVGPLSVAIALAALALFAAFIAAGEARCGDLVRSTLALLTVGAFQCPPDLARARRARQPVRLGDLSGWALPLGCGVVFVALFGTANPLIGQWLEVLNPLRLFELIGFWRVVFWLCLLMLVWPVIFPRVRKNWRLLGPGVGADDFIDPKLVPALFTPQSVLRSLILFNLLFAVQTGMDIAYLWGGLALPEGMTYANYVHRGAYPLIVTALLAAVFVLIAMPAREAPRPLLRFLVLAFILQNVMLVISSMLRLDLYIEVYSLTLLRVTAFVWMGLVAFGLALILARILFGKSNSWLIGANLITLTITLYVCAFVDFSGMVASYNVNRHIQHGAVIDRDYLIDLGPTASPAIDRLTGYDRAENPSDLPSNIFRKTDGMVNAHRARMQDWRGWTFRGQRLLNYLDAKASAKAQPKEETLPGAEDLS
jgi:hypothetical protein